MSFWFHGAKCRGQLGRGPAQSHLTTFSRAPSRFLEGSAEEKSSATHLPPSLRAPATSRSPGPGGVCPWGVFCGLLRVQRSLPTTKTILQPSPSPQPPGISGSAGGITPGSGLSWPLRASLTPVSRRWASPESVRSASENVLETFCDEGTAVGLFSCIHSFIQQILVCINCASATILGTEAKTAGKIMKVSARL